MVQKPSSAPTPINVCSTDGSAAIIRELGLKYDERPLPHDLSGWIEYDGDGYRIVVNAKEGPQRRRFTAAHELAHYLMHRDMLDNGTTLHRHTDALFGAAAQANKIEPFSPSHEVQANRFAAELLMPAKLVRAGYDATADNVADLARQFKVSKLAMKIRLANLGMRELD